MVRNCSRVMVPCCTCIASRITPQLSPERVSPNCTQRGPDQIQAEESETSPGSTTPSSTRDTISQLPVGLAAHPLQHVSQQRIVRAL